MIAAVFASGNAHKLAELRTLLDGWEIEPLGSEGPEETGTTYRANALLKAHAGRALAAPGRWVLAEDSGIECAVLEGAPGLHSARWAPGRDPVDALLERLDGESERSARMVSELVCITAGGEVVAGRGVMEGVIATAPRGEGGFGYDPVFVPVGFDLTVSELGEEWKMAHSHRARSAQAVLAALARLSPPPTR